MALGIAMVAGGGGLLWSMHRYRADARAAARRLLTDVTSEAASAAHAAARSQDHECKAPPLSVQTPSSAARAVLSVPSLGLLVPVLAGTDDAALDHGVGHLDTSTWPDQGGTTVLEAHDVTFFAHLPQLHVGELIRITAPCQAWSYRVTSGQVVPAGTPVPNRVQPTLVLVTCYPSDALFVTKKRYVVNATLIATQAAAPILPPATTVRRVHASLPSDLPQTQLSVDSAHVPLGRLHLVDPADPAGYKSDGGFQALGQATQLLVAAERAATEHRTDWWYAIAPGSAFAQADILAGPAHWLSLVDVTIDASDGLVTGAVLSGTVRTNAGPRAVTVSTYVEDTVMRISAITVAH